MTRRSGPLWAALCLAGCRSEVPPGEPTLAGLDQRLRESLGAPRATSGWERQVDSVAQWIGARMPPGASRRERIDSLAAWIDGPSGVAAVLQPGDRDLVPSLAWESRRGGCAALAWIWGRLGAGLGVGFRVAILPGHLVLVDTDGRYLETLRGGRVRSRAFYDSAFRLADRPAYPRETSIEDGLACAFQFQLGNLAWKRGDLETAQIWYRRADQRVPGLPETQGNLGLVLMASGRTDSAQIWLNRAFAGDRLHRRIRALPEP